MEFPHGVTVTVVTTTTVRDDLGGSTETTVETVWGPCAVAPRFATETADPRVAPIVVGKTLYGPAVEIHADDTIVLDGETWQVEGEPAEWINPFTGWSPGIEVPIVRASGVQ